MNFRILNKNIWYFKHYINCKNQEQKYKKEQQNFHLQFFSILQAYPKLDRLPFFYRRRNEGKMART